MRLFVASFFEESFRAALSALFAKQRRGGPVNWVKPEQLHLTYAFLGERAGAGEAEAAYLASALAGQKAFSLSTGGLGAFPSLASPKVLWLGAGEGVERLREVAGAVSGLLPERERTAFVPHITLGRVKAGLPPGFIDDLAVAVRELKAASRLVSVDLVSSVLTSGGPVYDKIFSGRLQ